MNKTPYSVHYVKEGYIEYLRILAWNNNDLLAELSRMGIDRGRITKIEDMTGLPESWEKYRT